MRDAGIRAKTVANPQVSAALDASLRSKRLQEELERLKLGLKSVQKELTSSRAEIEGMKAAKRAAELRLTKKLEQQGEELRVLSASISDSKAEERLRRRAVAFESKVAELRDVNALLRNQIGDKEDEAAAQVQAAEDAAHDFEAERKATAAEHMKEVAALKKRNKVLAIRSKNRGAKQKKLRKSLSAARQAGKKAVENAVLVRLPKRKLKDNIKPRQVLNRRRIVEANIMRVLTVSAERWGVDIKGYGKLEIVRPEVVEAKPWEVEIGEEQAKNYIRLRKDSPLKKKIGQFLFAHDRHAVSKKKIAMMRGLTSTCAIPPIYRLTEYQEQLNTEAKELFKLDIGEKHFIVSPREMLAYVLKLRGIYDPDAHVLFEADGRGTGNSKKTVIVCFRIINEGRVIHRSDRCYLLALCEGDESYDLIKTTLKGLRAELEALQRNGLTIEKPDGTEIFIQVHLHLLADGKFQKLAYGMVGFHLRDCNCLWCECHADDRAEVFVRHATDPNRFDNSRVGSGGRRKPDLFPFIPMSRRWGENMHIVLRFAGDKLVAQGFGDLINSEMGDEATGMRYIEEQMHSTDIKLPGFKFHGAGRPGGGKDASAEGVLSWTSLSYTDLLRVCEHLDFASGYLAHPELGRNLQAAITGFITQYKALLVWPGDGPAISADAIFKVHSEIIGAALGQSPPSQSKPDDDESDDASDSNTSGSESSTAEPGERGSKRQYLPRTTITPYAHSWINHWGEMYERSVALAPYFQHGDACCGRDSAMRGGLKPFLTQALERSNLHFFHNYYQTLDRRTKEMISRAGFQILRQMLNPYKTDRDKYWCMWCGRGYAYKGNYEKHEQNLCSQRPPDDDIDNAYYVAQAALADAASEGKVRA